MSIGSNICITCITFTYASFSKIFAKQEFSICTNWVAFTSTYPCWGKFMHHKHIHHKHIHLHLHPREGHLHYKHIHLHLHPHKGHLHYNKFSFALSYGCIHVCISDKDFCTRHSMNKHLHPHLHLHPHEGHLHNKTFIRTITRLRSCLHIQ